VAPDPTAERTAEPTAEQVERARTDPKLANVLYHDWEAASYDDKWSISYDERCIDYARGRFERVAGTAGWPYGDALELGSGTGFFLLNLRQAGVATRGHVTDLSPGMVEAAVRNGTALGLDVQGRVADAESIPYDDESFDLVLGHAVLHHIPDVELSLREVLRVLRPGGRFVFAGEPTTVGDWYARRLGRATWKAATTITRLPPLRGRWARPAEELHESSRAAALESVVDLHTFDPRELAATALRAGAVDVRTATEELTAAFLGWPVRTVEAAVNPARLGWGWAMFAYRSWQRLSAVDRVLGRVLPQALFYNVLVTGHRPG
jgi:SAM-dependent methyltransferase